MLNGQLKDATEGMMLTRLEDDSLFTDISQANTKEGAGPYDCWLLAKRAMQHLVTALNKGNLPPVFETFGITANKIRIGGGTNRWVYSADPDVEVNLDELPENCKSAPLEIEAAGEAGAA
jgi:hypothetical protein